MANKYPELFFTYNVYNVHLSKSEYQRDSIVFHIFMKCIYKTRNVYQNEIILIKINLAK